jgi:hypothetical protein
VQALFWSLISLRHERNASDGLGEDRKCCQSLLVGGGKVTPYPAEARGTLRASKGTRHLLLNLSFGEYAKFHPHWHVLVLEGGFTKYDRFVYLPIGSDEGLLKVWQAAILSMDSTKARPKCTKALNLSTNW